MGKKGKKKNKKQLEDELNRQQEEQKRKEQQERLQQVEEDAWKAQQERVEAELDAKNRIEEAERLEEESSIVASMKGERKTNLEYEQQSCRTRSIGTSLCPALHGPMSSSRMRSLLT